MKEKDKKSEIIKNLRFTTELDVLGFLLYSSDKEKKFELAMNLELINFKDSINAIIYKHLLEVLVKLGSCDVVLLGNKMRGESPEVLTRLVEIPARDYFREAVSKAGELRDRTTLERIGTLSIDLRQKADLMGSAECLKILEDFIFDEYKRDTKTISLLDAASQVISEAKSRINRGYNWIDSLPELTNVTGGIERGKLYVIGATKKSGKTRFAVAIMKSLLDQSQSPLFLSMEMKELEVAKLFLSVFTGVSTSVFNRELSEIDEAQLRAGLDKFSEIVSVDCEGHLSVEKMRAKIWRASNQGSNIVVIDYLQRMQYNEQKNKNWATIVSDSVARIADIGRDYNVAIILLSQLRNAAEGEEINDMSFLKDSGGIAENADTIITLTNRQRQGKGESKYSSKEEIDFWISVEQRSGETKLIKTEAKLAIMDFQPAKKKEEA